MTPSKVKFSVTIILEDTNTGVTRQMITTPDVENADAELEKMAWESQAVRAGMYLMKTLNNAAKNKSAI